MRLGEPLRAQHHGSLSTIATAGDNIDLIVPGLIARLVVLRKWPSLGLGVSNCRSECRAG
jgi:hypothetical protein